MKIRPFFHQCIFFLMVHSFSAIAENEWTVASIQFDGNEEITKDKLLDQMRIQLPLLWFESEHTFSKVADDVEVLKVYYRTKGFLDARISVGEIDRDSTHHHVNITIDINEGIRTIIDSISFKNNIVFSDSALHAFISLKPGDLVDSVAFAQIPKLLQDSLRAHGYLYAKVERCLRFGTNRQRADLIFTMQEGPVVQVAEIIIDGIHAVKPSVVKRAATFKEGDRLNSRKVTLSVRRLYQTNVFDFVSITPLDTADVPTGIDTLPVPVLVRVEETQMFSIQAGWSNQFYKIKGDVRKYVAFFSEQLGMVSALFAGYTNGLGGSANEVPAQERFRITSEDVRPVRGYENTAIVPLDENGNPEVGDLQLF